MSRAFVNEDNLVEELPERPISPHPNFVTAAGLAAIDAALAAAQRAYGKAQARADREALAKAARELRYWNSRRLSAEVVTPSSATNVVQFGHAVTFARNDGRKQTFRIVGEDEADPSKGLVSHVSPLARALLGKAIGDVVRAGSSEAKIAGID